MAAGQQGIFIHVLGTDEGENQWHKGGKERDRYISWECPFYWENKNLSGNLTQEFSLDFIG